MYQGAACGFPHGKERVRSATLKPADKSTKQCSFFALGTCKFGDECRDLHGGGGPRGASPKAGPKGKGKPKGKPAAAAVAASILKAHVPQPVPGSVALAASTHHGPRDDCQSWLIDTGCKYDLTTRASVPSYLHDSIEKALVPITLSAAKGLTDCDLCVRQQILGLTEVVEPYILDSTTDVLSIGRRCVEDGCAFHLGTLFSSPNVDYG